MKSVVQFFLLFFFRIVFLDFFHFLDRSELQKSVPSTVGREKQ